MEVGIELRIVMTEAPSLGRAAMVGSDGIAHILIGEVGLEDGSGTGTGPRLTPWPAGSG